MAWLISILFCILWSAKLCFLCCWGICVFLSLSFPLTFTLSLFHSLITHTHVCALMHVHAETYATDNEFNQNLLSTENESLGSHNTTLPLSQLPLWYLVTLNKYLVPQSLLLFFNTILHNPPSTEIPKALPIIDSQRRKETHTKSDFASHVKMSKKTPSTPQLPFVSEKTPRKTGFDLLNPPLIYCTRGKSMLK